ncbi:MAG: TraR/DksA family transcriptional regulator [Porticoccaceae bacterium]|jgi:DnaK suppressor protein|nr:TraR/DksA family transcriptional regulator [Porticoccaceae bacterium]MBT3798439.1 TraR/DksA family transcriptional regulator [Porticoccaceae bacterium]MBT4163906.1 TraR/DksA family transcriptional regulator [Porticoccaceae bacterium]MBT4591211.1 TraR/DksA family transcriptional regulator [Porticoccaceae bacterium]MBT5004496.1 TraR/DksA family transcriptional regulator [Porticoccaceae bacterium]
MDNLVVENFRRALLELRAQLTELEAISCEATKPVQLDQSMVGRLSRMDAMQGVEMAKEASRRRKQQLARIPAALERIATEDYGRCTLCDEDIVIGRLHIDPTYTRCINCADQPV